MNMVLPSESTEPLANLNFDNKFTKELPEMMAGKLGLSHFSEKTDDFIIKELVEILQLTETDMTIFFRNLSMVTPALKVTAENALPASLQEAYYKPSAITEEYRNRMNRWLQHYLQRLRENTLSDEQRIEKMNSLNPQYVLRNYLAQVAIDRAEQGNFSEVDAPLNLLRNPNNHQPGKEKYAEKKPEWARNRAGCPMLSCSS